VQFIPPTLRWPLASMCFRCSSGASLARHSGPPKVVRPRSLWSLRALHLSLRPPLLACAASLTAAGGDPPLRSGLRPA
jgi:hypothetical protein